MDASPVDGAPFRMIDEHGRPMTVSATGVVRLLGSEWGRISADGTVTDPFGALRARLDGERVVDACGETFALLTGDGVARVGETELHFAESGALVGGPTEITLEPADSPSRRAALLVVLIALLRPSERDIETAPEVELTFDLRPDL